MESTLIYHMGHVKAHFALNKKRIFYTTRVKANRDAIDNRGFIKSKAHPNWQNLNQQILFHKQKLDDAILKDLQRYGEVDVDRIKAMLRSSLLDALIPKREIESKSECSCSSMVDDFISNQPNMDTGLRGRLDLLKSIVKDYDLKCGEIRVPYLNDLLDRFRAGVNANTAYTRYKNFKRLLSWCTENGYPIPKIQWKRLRRPTFKPDFVFLTDERIHQLIEFKTTFVFEQNVRDIFLVLIYTGMRYSDYLSLNRTEVHHGYIDKVAKKTKIRFKVPVHSIIRDIVDSPPKMCSQLFNRGLQSIGKKLNWTEMVKYRKDVDEFKMIPFYEMLCSSVGRHTFATRALMSGIPHNIIMGWCGWSNSSMLFYYSEKLKIETTDWMAKIK